MATWISTPGGPQDGACRAFRCCPPPAHSSTPLSSTPSHARSSSSDAPSSPVSPASSSTAHLRSSPKRLRSHSPVPDDAEYALFERSAGHLPFASLAKSHAAAAAWPSLPSAQSSNINSFIPPARSTLPQRNIFSRLPTPSQAPTGSLRSASGPFTPISTKRSLMSSSARFQESPIHAFFPLPLQRGQPPPASSGGVRENLLDHPISADSMAPPAIARELPGMRRSASEIDTPAHPPAALVHGRRSHESTMMAHELGLGLDESDYEASPCRRIPATKSSFGTASYKALSSFPTRPATNTLTESAFSSSTGMSSNLVRARQLSSESTSSFSAFSTDDGVCESPSVRAPRPVRPPLRRGTTLPVDPLSMPPPAIPLTTRDVTAVKQIEPPLMLPASGLRRKSGGQTDSQTHSLGRPQPPEAPKKTKMIRSLANMRSARLAPPGGRGIQRKRSQSDLLTPNAFIERLAKVKSVNNSSPLGLFPTPEGKQSDLFLTSPSTVSTPAHDVLLTPSAYAAPYHRDEKVDMQTVLTPPLSSAEESFWSSGDEKNLSFKLLNVSVTSSRSNRSLAAINDTSEFRDRMAEDFQLIANIGSGAFSRVIRVKDKHSSTHYAVKQIKLDDGSKRERQVEEVSILRYLSRVPSPYIIRFVDSWIFDSSLFIQTELVENKSLHAHLTAAGDAGGVGELKAWKMLLELAEGVRFLHQNDIIHLDLKPANVLVTVEGRLKIADFGTAAMCRPHGTPGEYSPALPQLEDDGGFWWPDEDVIGGDMGMMRSPGIDREVEGDKTYLSPEALRDNGVGRAADVFALGITILEAAFNINLPGDGEDWQKLRNDDLSDLSVHYVLRSAKNVKELRVRAATPPPRHCLNHSTSSNASTDGTLTPPGEANEDHWIPVVSQPLFTTIKHLMASHQNHRMTLDQLRMTPEIRQLERLKRNQAKGRVAGEGLKVGEVMEDDGKDVLGSILAAAAMAGRG